MLTSLPQPTQTKVTNQHPEAKAKDVFVSLLQVDRAQVRMRWFVNSAWVRS